MAMSKRTRIVLIVIAVAVAAYLAYRWYQGRQSSQQGTTDTTGMGSNLNSLAPELVAGSSGPSSGLDYTPGNTQVDITLPGGGPTQDVTGSNTDSGDGDNDGRHPPPLPCPGGAHWDAQKHMCVFGWGEMGPCPGGMKRDPRTGKCVPPPRPPRRPPKKKKKVPVGVGTGMR